MNLSISNIGWSEEEDEKAYSLMEQYGFKGLEIAPTRIFPEDPYGNLKQASAWAERIARENGFSIPSMQSIWYGRQEKIFGTEKERELLLGHTKKAIDFAVAIRCKNLVLGCPKNRVIPEGADPEVGRCFFRELGEYAALKGTAIGFEANPSVYHTNYMNETSEAFDLIEAVGSAGFRLNLDVGTMVQNGEQAEEIKGKVKLINHVHISEPGLKKIEKRELHRRLLENLASEGYEGYISIEMGKESGLEEIENAMRYVKEIFG